MLSNERLGNYYVRMIYLISMGDTAIVTVIRRWYWYVTAFISLLYVRSLTKMLKFSGSDTHIKYAAI